VETAYLLVEASEALGKEDNTTWTLARRIVDHALDFGYDTEHGGLYDSGGTFTPAAATDKIWWVQAETLNALLLMHEKYGQETPRYWEAFVRQWAFIEDHQIDRQNGGWFKTVSREGVALAGDIKSDRWTEGYHQGRALLNVSTELSKMGSSGSPVVLSQVLER
jgi:mannobiose 2-epimerase